MPEETRNTSGNHLILLTNHFPFGKGEAFLEEEFRHLSAAFNSIIIITKNTGEPQTRTIPESTKVFRISPKSNFKDYITSVKSYATTAAYSPHVVQEWNYIMKSKVHSKVEALTTMFHDITKALLKAKQIETIIEQNRLQGNIFLYSYWLDSSALATLYVSSNTNRIVRISRAHGGDVYEYRHKNHYLSFRRALLNGLDRIFTISENGREHLSTIEDKAPVKNLITARLGTKNGTLTTVHQGEKFKVLSCAFMLPVKRIDLLINALATCSLEIEWHHIGDGPLRPSLEELAKQKLSGKENIACTFHGHLTTEQLRDFYLKNCVHLFVNTSESEGIPVTMMEAQSFGVPVVAPAVGGIPELVNEKTGILFPADSTAEVIGDAIEKILSMSEQEYGQLRVNSFENWNSRFNADRNFSTFVREILSLKNDEV
jgi:glycosyltransferase involved in cell wall biosynthesis